MGNRANIQARRFLAACAARVGGVVPFSREIKRNAGTVNQVMSGKGVRGATARDFHDILRRLGFAAPTGLEPVTLPMTAPSEPDTTPPEVA